MACSMVPARAFALDSTITPPSVEENIATPAPVLSDNQEQASPVVKQAASQSNLPALPSSAPISIQEQPSNIPPFPKTITPFTPQVPVKVIRAPIPANGQIIVSAIQSTATTVDAIELRNMDDKPIDLSQWHADIVYVKAGEENSCRVQLSGYLFARQQTTIARNGVTLTSDRSTPQPYLLDFSCGIIGGTVAAVEVGTNRDLTERIQLENSDGTIRTGTWVRKGTTTTYRTGDFLTDFKLDSTHKFFTMDLYYPPETTALRITEVYSNPPACKPVDSAVLCGKYIKLTNPSNQPVELGSYRLRAGLSTTASTSANTSSLAGTIQPQQTILVQKTGENTPIYLASSEGSVWLQDKYGFRDYGSDVTPYAGADSVKNEGLSWAYDLSDGVWKWSLPSPDSVENNIRLPLAPVATSSSVSQKACRDDQYRSEETGRCRNLVAATSVAPCKDGQYRSEETNRCRSLALAGGTLAACHDDQYRSETTNRCRNIATATSSLVPCKDNQYRSEETHRCRNATAASAPEAAFAVEPVADAGKAFVGWWALGGVGVLALGYGVWEWRQEMMVGIRKIGSFFHSSK